MTVANMMIAIANENTRKPNSDAHDFKVYPKILKPCECRENLKIRNTLNTLKVTKAPDTSSLSVMNKPI